MALTVKLFQLLLRIYYYYKRFTKVVSSQTFLNSIRDSTCKTYEWISFHLFGRLYQKTQRRTRDILMGFPTDICCVTGKTIPTN